MVDNTEKVRIRRAGAEDLNSILKIERQSFPTPWDGGMYMVEFMRKDSEFLVAEKDGKAVGYVCAWKIADEGHVLKIAVGMAERNRGIGKALMDTVNEILKQRGAHEMLLEVRDGNEAGLKFYRALGFEKIGIRKKYYSDTGEDAILMIKDI